MKKIYIKLLQLSALSGLLLSCSSNHTIGITKRHYRSGYFIENTIQVNSKKEKPAALTAPKIAVSNSAPAEDKAIRSGPASNPANAMNGAPSMSRLPSLTENNKDFSSQDRQKIIPNVIVGRYLPENKTHSLSQMQDDGDHHHHTLGGFLWFIVVLLLILFLLNFLLALNLGGLVYLILLIAVILLLFRLIDML
jgi:hypothetical protein